MSNKTSLRLFIIRLIPVSLHPAILNIANSLSRFFGSQNVQQLMYSPTWKTIQHGPGKGIHLFFDDSGEIGKEMIQGTYDDYFFESIRSEKPEGKTIFDVGAHIGYDSLIFAALVKSKGQVVAFEPNPYNRERLSLHLEHNAPLHTRVQVFEYALSDQEGTAEFLMSSRVDGWASSGSFLDSAHTNLEHSMYEKSLGFQRVQTPITTLDIFCKKNHLKPDIIKIDVEGAEQEVLLGAKKIIATLKPVFYIELHSIFSSFKVTEFLVQHGYTIELLHEEKDGRCFVRAAQK